MPLLHLSQAGLSLYTLQFSYKSIDALTGGDTAQRAAKYSNKAAFQVFHVKGTQTAGAVSLITSLVLSIFLATCASLPNMGFAPAVGGKLMLNVAEAAVIAGSAIYIRQLWKARAKIPSSKADDYNDAITSTNVMRMQLVYLAILWSVTGLLEMWNFGLQ